MVNNMELLSYLLGKKSSGGGGTPTKYSPRAISFYYYTGTELDYEIENLDTKNMTSMEVMFDFCSNLTSLDLSTFDTSNVTSMAHMFDSCSNLTSLDLSTFDTSKLTNIDYMFNKCKKLTFIDIRTFDFTTITSYTNMVGTASNNGPANDCLIIVKDDTAKTAITTTFSRLTNVKTVAEYESDN